MNEKGVVITYFIKDLATKFNLSKTGYAAYYYKLAKNKGLSIFEMSQRAEFYLKNNKTFKELIKDTEKLKKIKR